jgi:hypothetical protein
MKFQDLTSKAAQLRFMRDKLATDPRYVVKGLLTIYTFQTADEQRVEATDEHNGVGFNSADAKYLSSIAVQMKARGVERGLANPSTFDAGAYVTPKQWPIVNKKMQKYAEQLCRVARDKMAAAQQK